MAGRYTSTNSSQAAWSARSLSRTIRLARVSGYSPTRGPPPYTHGRDVDSTRRRPPHAAKTGLHSRRTVARLQPAYAPGTSTAWPHWGHLTFLPTTSGLARSVLPQPGQTKE